MRFCLLALLCLLVISVRSQVNNYILNGYASQNSCNCYTLTPPVNYTGGSVWNTRKINLNDPFDFNFNVFLGCKDTTGADGIVFILQTTSNSIGGHSEGMGFVGITPSLGIALDTWSNETRGDPLYDHMSIQINGNINEENDIAGPVQASDTSNNIEDCKWHELRIVWDPGAQLIQTYFDGVFRVEANIDLVGTVFNASPEVYWGFSGGTGGQFNLQQFCTALNPNFNTNFTNNATCINDNTIVFNNTSVSFAAVTSQYWEFGDGTSSTDKNPPPHVYPSPGLYTVRLAITALDGCESDTLERIVAVGDYPIADFAIHDTCSGIQPRIEDRSHVVVGSLSKWLWSIDGAAVPPAQYPTLNNLPPGNHTIQLQVASNYGCSSAPIQKVVNVIPSPSIKANALGNCMNIPVAFTAQQLDNATTISNWKWTFDKFSTGIGATSSYSFDQPGKYQIQLEAIADNGCKSSTDVISIDILKAIANAGTDTVVIENEPFQLHGSGGIGYAWNPPIGLSNASIANPSGTLTDDQEYVLTITTPEGCTATDKVKVTVFKGSVIYVPSAFTPNHDGLNEILKPYYAGIRMLQYFTVYNRWGQLIYQSKSLGEGWDGTFNGIKQPPGVYVWRLKAIDVNGKLFEVNGNSTLIR